jgi:hypothetical protein
VFNLKCPFAQRRPAARVRRASSGRAAARIGPASHNPLSPPKVDHLGCLAVCWETEL